MPDERKWYYAENKERKGPFDESVFIGMITSGTLIPETLVWTKGFEKWRLLANTELASHLEGDVPPPPEDFEVEAQPQTSPVVKQPEKSWRFKIMTWERVSPVLRKILMLILLCISFPAIFYVFSFLMGDGVMANILRKASSMILGMAFKVFWVTIPCLLPPIAVYVLICLICSFGGNSKILRFLTLAGGVYLFYKFGGGKIALSPSGAMELVKFAFQLYLLIMLVIPDALRANVNVMASGLGSGAISLLPDLPGPVDDVMCASAIGVLTMTSFYINMLSVFIKKLTEQFVAFIDQHRQRSKEIRQETDNIG